MRQKIFFSAIINLFLSASALAQVPIVPSLQELNRPFDNSDAGTFKTPPRIHYPETWFHYIGGNVSLPGITADLESIAQAGLSGVQLFHGQFGGAWPGVEPQIACLSPLWDDAVNYTAKECRRLGLRFTMQNCPGWAMSGGPWIAPSNAMRHLAYSRTDVETSGIIRTTLPIPQPSQEPWRDYQDIAVIAFPTPLGDTGKPSIPSLGKSSSLMAWEKCFSEERNETLELPATTTDTPHWVEVEFPKETIIRTLELPSINSMSHAWCYDPGIRLSVEAILPDGKTVSVLQTDLPASNWQDDAPLSLACSEVAGVTKYRITIQNQHNITLGSIRLFSSVRKNSWESEAGWTLRSINRQGMLAKQSSEAYLNRNQIYDLSEKADTEGKLMWEAPTPGKWTILRIGHVNTGMKNAPAPPEGTGWECDKLSERGANAQFAGYIGRLSEGALQGGLLNGMLLDSWECKTQTWTVEMENEFSAATGYSLRKWFPALFGYVVDDTETTTRFLLDWRRAIGTLFTDRFYGRMAKLAKENGLTIAYETAAGDIFPADILEYYKYADVPMCEYWQPFSDGFVGSLNFKPIKPTVSAARLYGKPRVSAEAFTSFELTWDEHWQMLKEVANINSIEGVTHPVFHTYTHNPRTDFLPPGTSFGSNIGTPFLRGQTWWKYMPEFTGYLARCSYLLERGKPVSDILWYLGDEMNHKPDQNASFPAGFKYDYCNPDILLNRLSVKDGRLTTPEGISYRILWMPDTQRMLPETLEKLYELLREGAVVVANAPQGVATLTEGEFSEKRMERATTQIWGKEKKIGARKVGKGTILSGMSLETALEYQNMSADVKGGDVLWSHRKTEGAEWYFVCAPKGGEFKGTIDFHASGKVELWDPVTGECFVPTAVHNGSYTSIDLDLPQAGSCFLVFRTKNGTKSSLKQRKIPTQSIELNTPWTLSFPTGWGVPQSVQVAELKAWKELDLPTEAKAFSGTVTYTTTFNLDQVSPETSFSLDLGRVEMIAAVSLNGKPLRTLWCAPYRLDLKDVIQEGENELTIEVTSSWFNRLVYDAGISESNRKTWTINGPDKNSPLKDNGLLGPVVLHF